MVELRLSRSDIGLGLNSHNRGPLIVTEPPHNPTVHSRPLTVLYDGSCPLCRSEIGIYRGLQPWRADSPVCFIDVSDAAVPLPSTLPADTTREQMLTRFHIQGSDGRLFSGAEAFLALWSALPGWRWLGLAGRVPGVAWVMERAYILFLRWRPMLQRCALRLEQLHLKRLGPDRRRSHENTPR